MFNISSVSPFIKSSLFKKISISILVLGTCLLVAGISTWKYSEYKLTHPPVLQAENITDSILVERLHLADRWYTKNGNLTNGNTMLLFDMLKYTTDNSTNINSQLNSLATFEEFHKFFGLTAVDTRINRYLTGILQYQRTKDNYAYIEYAGHAYLSTNAYLVDAFLATDYTNKNYYVTLYANSLLAAQKPDGSYILDLKNPEYMGKEVGTFPGQAMRALMHAYTYTKDPIYINSVIKAYPYYKKYWYEHRTILSVAKLTPGLVSLYNETNNQDVYNTIVDMNNYLINNQVIDTDRIYEVGHFKSRESRPVSVYVESLNLVYPILKDANLKQRYKYAIQMGMQNILATQILKSNLILYHAKYQSNILGGFVEHVGSSTIELDNNAHGLMAIFMSFRNNIFR